jgi:hypothetical protein
MNQLDQRLYRLFKKDDNEFVHVFEGERHVGQILTTLSLSGLILSDYLGCSTYKLNVSKQVILRLSHIFSNKIFHEGIDINDCSVCGITVKECINGTQGPESV